MSAADVAAGKWLPTANTSAAGMPSIPLLVFQLPDTHNGSSSSSSADGAAAGAGSSSSGGSQTCWQRRLGSAEVPGCLWAAGFDRVVVSGDSTVRMLWNRLHYLVRQSPVSFDVAASMTHGHYVLEMHDSSPAGGTAGGSGSSSVADGAIFATDSLWFAPPGNVRPQVFNDSVMMDGLQHLIKRTGAAGRGSGGGSSGGSSSSGSSRRLTLDFLVGSTSAWQQRHVRQYVASDMGGDASWPQRTLLVLSLCIWEGKDVRPAGWFEFLEEMRQQVAQVVLLTCPTERFGVPDRFATRRVVAQRNDVLRQLVADSRGGSSSDGGSGSDAGDSSSSSSSAGTGSSSGGSGTGSNSSSGAGPKPFLLLDLDAMTKWLPREVALSPHDFHYQCYPVTQSAYTVGSLEWAGGDGSPLPLYPPRKLSHLNIAANGWCADPVDYSAWQLLFHMLCPGRDGE
ncbi:hypothetical protein COHA_001760 [Chlorella ohadii]|uniref:Uncharacterized protein n=1 Tax=Chlorella ohadii TaxID=2649997 RepID=A0AAD5H5J9_9CHLO|nr:hypothetical protein COHA_001760 [Chlorella ohadii]